MNKTELLLEDSILAVGVGAAIFSFMPYAALYPDHLFQLVEAFIEIALEGGILLFLYGLGGVYFYGTEGDRADHETYLNECGGYIVITTILILILMSLGSIFTAATHQPLF